MATVDVCKVAPPIVVLALADDPLAAVAALAADVVDAVAADAAAEVSLRPQAVMARDSNARAMIVLRMAQLLEGMA